MAAKDQRSIRSTARGGVRVGRYQDSGEASPIASTTPVEPAVDTEDARSPKKGTMKLPDAILARHSLVNSVPTPVRSPTAGLQPEQQSPTRGSAVDNSFALGNQDAFGVPPPVPLAAPKGNYREWLQARGQQAMQRSQQMALSSSPSNRTGATAPANTPVMAPSPQMMAGQDPSQVVSWAMPTDHQVQPWFGMDISPMNGQQSPMAYTACSQPAASSPMVADSSSQKLSFGMNGQQTPIVYGPGQQTPIGFSSFQPGGTTPMGQTPVSFHMCSQMPVTPAATSKNINDQDMVCAQFLPFNGLDGEQIAKQLRAAAPEVYDD